MMNGSQKHFQKAPVQALKILENWLNNSSSLEESYVKDKKVADQFGTHFQFKIHSKNGRDIEKISEFGNEKEVLFKSNTKFKVLNFEKNIFDGYTETLIELFEI